MADMDQEFLEFVIKGLVDHPEEVKISRVVDEMGVLLTLDLNPEDMGKVIGRQGNTAKAIRTLLRVVGMKHNARVNLKINEPEGGSPGPRMRSEGDSYGSNSGSVTKVSMSNSQSTSPTMKTVDEAMAELEL